MVIFHSYVNLPEGKPIGKPIGISIIDSIHDYYQFQYIIIWLLVLTILKNDGVRQWEG